MVLRPFGTSGKIRDLEAAEIVVVAVAIHVVGHPIGGVADPTGERAEVGLESLPLCRNTSAVGAVVTLDESREESGLHRL